MLREQKQVHISEHQLKKGLGGADVPGEPVAYIKLAPTGLASRYDLTFKIPAISWHRT